MEMNQAELQKSVINKITDDIMKMPPDMRGTILEDAHTISGGDEELLSRILKIAFTLCVASKFAYAGQEEDPIGAAVVRSGFVVYRHMIETIAKQRKDSKITIENLTGALAILKEDKE